MLFMATLHYSFFAATGKNAKLKYVANQFYALLCQPCYFPIDSFVDPPCSPIRRTSRAKPAHCQPARPAQPFGSRPAPPAPSRCSPQECSSVSFLKFPKKEFCPPLRNQNRRKTRVCKPENREIQCRKVPQCLKVSESRDRSLLSEEGKAQESEKVLESLRESPRVYRERKKGAY